MHALDAARRIQSLKQMLDDRCTKSCALPILNWIKVVAEKYTTITVSYRTIACKSLLVQCT